MNGFVKNMKESTIDIAFLPVVTAKKYNTTDISVTKKEEKLNGRELRRETSTPQVPFCRYCVRYYDNN